MVNQQRKPLVVYKASAGSGKTFRLALEYIKLLVENPNNYRHILAVTFTNKATEEMKNRILSQLYGISRGLKDSDTESYVELMMKESGYTDTFIRERAGIALNNLLHNYSFFRVETIDSFFQSVLRNLAHELDLSANLRLELNDKQIEQQAVDEMIEGLNKSSAELGWILDYIRDNIDDDKGWNVIGQIKKFGENIFKEVYQKDREELTRVLHEKDFFKQYVRKLRTIREEAAKDMVKPAEKFFTRLEELGLSVNDFTRGETGVPGYFVKLRKEIFSTDKLLTKTVVDAMDDPNKWVKKADQHNGSAAYRAVNQEFIPLLKESEESRPKNYLLYKSADLTLRHMNQLRLLDSIDACVRESNKQTNRFLLSDTQALLHSLIKASDSPFIFEKIGSQLQHIMIDEFQDTSSIQWQNFKVLLNECMSQAHSKDLIVGDVKQSIYRWRDGDWMLLNNIESEFYDHQIETTDLKVNRRSSSNVINFNNAFFEKAVKAEYDNIVQEDENGAKQLALAYKDVNQDIPEDKDKDGYVRVDLLPSDNYEATTMEMIESQLKELIEAGVSQNDIAILVRSNKTIQDIAEHLMLTMPELKLVSNEAFRLDASPAVCMIVEAMRSLSHPDDDLSRAYLAKNYQKLIIKSDIGDSGIFEDPTLLQTFLPTEFTSNAEFLRSQPVYDLAEQLFTIFGLSELKEQSAYICAFYDQLRKFLGDGVADLNMFLDAWDETIRSKTIQSDGAEGVRLLTIHKSKGLEFQNVLLPFCDWKLERSSLIWCKPEAHEQPFNELPLVPIDFSASQMRGTIFNSDYLNEHLQNTVDNLNLLYVAFTRAKNNLFVIGKLKAGGTRSMLLETVMENVSKSLPESSFEEEENGPIHFEYGKLKTKKHSEELSENIFRQKPIAIDVDASSHEARMEFRQSNQSRNFVSGDDDEERQKSYIELGTVMHEIFSTIRTLDDIPAALARLEADGVIYDKLITREHLSEMLRKRFSDPRVADWFSDRWQLFSECAILFVDPETNEVKDRRPDRVIINGCETIVIDFKFGKPQEEHKKQVHDYMSYLADMGYQGVKGYLWYVYSNKIEEV
ncbi:MAG: UvrD-helicase domain-containing protein [Prevotella sp.]|nr:UvrD-helicase domain-containing protein [Prevotella sp.]